MNKTDESHMGLLEGMADGMVWEEWRDDLPRKDRKQHMAEVMADPPTLDHPLVRAASEHIGASFDRVAKRLLPRCRGVVAMVFLHVPGEEVVYLVVERRGHYLGLCWAHPAHRDHWGAYTPNGAKPMHLHDAILGGRDLEQYLNRVQVNEGSPSKKIKLFLEMS